MLIDDVTIQIKAGKGGDGIVAFNKNKWSKGPAGGSGGRGGDMYVKGVSDLSLLYQFRYKKELHAQDGKNGRGQFIDGTSGEDLVLNIPVGTVIHNLTKHTRRDITHAEQRVKIAQGGKGGKGNFLFRSSTNTTPKEFEYGTPGEEFTLRFELKLIADVGFVGLPNVGKSSLLNILTKASAKVANYPFTTLEPNLGVYGELILADIPGLIEGAWTGKGLGDKFLRHIERTHTLFHFISAESDNPTGDYALIRQELGAYSKKLLEKPEYLFLTKSDIIEPAMLKKKLLLLKKHNKTAISISVIDDKGMENVKKILRELIKEKRDK